MRSPIAHADSLVVLSGSASYHERIQGAVRLYKEGRAPRIILTNDNQKGGWSQEKQRNPFFYERELDELVRSGVPIGQIDVILQPVSSTYDEALLLRDFTRDHQIESLLIVTSAYHSRRAFWIFRHLHANTSVQLGIETVGLGTDSPGPATWWLRPSGWSVVTGEYIKLGYYWFHY